MALLDIFPSRRKKAELAQFKEELERELQALYNPNGSAGTQGVVPASLINHALASQNTNLAARVKFPELTIAPGALHNWIWRIFITSSTHVAKVSYVGGMPRYEIVDSKWTELLDGPAPEQLKFGGYNWDALLYAVISSLLVNGKAYIYKMRDPITQQVIKYDFIPYNRLEVRNDKRNNAAGSLRLTYYRDKKTGDEFEPGADVVALRYGLDSESTVEGVGPLKAALSAIATSQQVMILTNALLERGGALGYVLVPKQGSVEDLTEEETRALSKKIRRNSTGENAGNVTVLNMPMELLTTGRAPSELNLSEHQKHAIQLVFSQFGIDPLVVGLESSNPNVYRNYKDSVQQAYRQFIEPFALLIQRQFTTLLLGDVEPRYKQLGLTVYINLEAARWMFLDKSAEYATLKEAFLAGGITRAEYRTGMGYPTSAEDDKYYHEIQGAQLQQDVANADAARRKLEEDGEDEEA